MTDQPVETSAELIRGKINSETARIAWTDLQRHFASGSTLFVESELDLVEVGYAFQEDDADQVAQWIEAGGIRAVESSQAKYWFDTNADVWAVVVKPWILIQNIKDAE